MVLAMDYDYFRNTHPFTSITYRLRSSGAARKPTRFSGGRKRVRSVNQPTDDGTADSPTEAKHIVKENTIT